MMQKIWKMLTGYVIIELQGLALEGQINRSLKKRVRFYTFRRISYTRAQATLSFFNYLRLKRLGTNLTITVLKRGGVMGALYFCRRRPFLAGGFLLCISLMFLSTNICFSVEIRGLETVSYTHLSSGGMGNTLKAASAIFVTIICDMMSAYTSFCTPNCKEMK